MADDKKAVLPPKTGVLLPQEKADVLNSVDRAIKADKVTASRSPDDDVKLVYDQRVKRLQDLFVKIRQDL